MSSAGAGHNRLAREKSPYLLQHAGNPVDWYPWGDEAFERAAREERPVFLSVGYSTCHWCHVMAHESFEDEQVARLMNETFVNIKLDREERPDIDEIYMTVCQMMTGGGGWPLTIVMTPDRRPFFAATYIPRETRFGRVGMLELVPRIGELWRDERARIDDSAQQITAALQQTAAPAPGDSLDPRLRELAREQLTRRFDAVHGGFGSAPKFPTPHVLSFLLRQHLRVAEQAGRVTPLEMVVHTLRHMRRGGIFDHVGFGFHRYSTDPRWLVPHFEKMLHDQALLVVALVEAYQLGGAADLARTAREVVTYVLRDLTDPEGGFYSAEDADSEGVEGKFYLWTRDELRRLLPAGDAELVERVFSVDEGGNYREEASGEFTGANILHLRRDPGDLAEDLGLSPRELDRRLESCRQILFEHREQRVHPGKDDKILTDWNGLMIAALARAGQVLDEPAYTAAAARAAGFVHDRLRDGRGRLLHRYRAGEASIPGMVDDHAFMVWGLLELYEADFDPGHLSRALELNRAMLDHFWDQADGGLFTTADDAEALIVRRKSLQDGAIPSGNSVAMLNLLRLARITGDGDLERRAEQLGRAFAGQVGSAPAAFAQLMVGLDFAVGPSSEVVIAGRPGADDTRTLVRALRSTFVPNKVALLRPTDEPDPRICDIAPWTRARTEVDGRAAAHVCQDFTCSRPVADPDQLLARLEADPPAPRSA